MKQIIAKTTVEKYNLCSSLAEEFGNRVEYSNIADIYKYKAYNEELKLQFEAEVLYAIEKYPEMKKILNPQDRKL